MIVILRTDCRPDSDHTECLGFVDSVAEARQICQALNPPVTTGIGYDCFVGQIYGHREIEQISDVAAFIEREKPQCKRPLAKVTEPDEPEGVVGVDTCHGGDHDPLDCQYARCVSTGKSRR